jgi:hypothetical protein
VARKPQDDDIDDILSGIMRGEADDSPAKHQTKNHYTAPPKKTKKQKKAKDPNSKGFFFTLGAVIKYFFSRKIVKVSFYVILLILILILIGFTTNKLYPNLLNPTPFNTEIKESVGYSLYYPKDLPQNFKIESDSVQEADPGVVVYAISDEDGHRLTVSMQRLPEGLNLEPLTNSLQDTYEIDTPLGKAMVGKTENGMLIANLIVDETWIIVNTPNANITTDQMNTVLQGLSKG